MHDEAKERNELKLKNKSKIEMEKCYWSGESKNGHCTTRVSIY